MKLNLFYKIVFFVCLFSFPVNLKSQDRKTLESVKSSNIEKLNYAKKLLESTYNDKKKNLSSLYVLNKGIEYRQSLIENYEEELDFISYDIEYLKEEISEGEKEMESLKLSYAKIVGASYRNLDDQFWLMYILSSEDINQSYRRYKYLKYINEYRKELFEEIVEKNDYLAKQIDSLKMMQYGKELTLKEVDGERKKLLSSQNEKIALQKELQKRESELLKQVKEAEQIQKRIELEIKKLIEEEARKAREANRLNNLTPAEKIIDGNFGNNKGGLPWPKEQVLITGKY